MDQCNDPACMQAACASLHARTELSPLGLPSPRMQPAPGHAPRVLLARRAGTSAPRAIESQRHVSLASSARHIGSSELTRLCAAAGRRRTVRTAVVHRARSMRGSKIEARHLVVGSDPWQHPSRLGSPTLSAAAHVADTRRPMLAQRRSPRCTSKRARCAHTCVRYPAIGWLFNT